MNLYISTYLAPYRLDLCERLFCEYGFEIFHYCGKEVPDDVAPFLGEYTFRNNRLPVRCLLGKPYAPGLRSLIERERPSVVLIQEFSLITLQLLRLRRKFGFRLISICDDSLDMIEGNDFKWTHRIARRWVPRRLDGLVLNSEAVSEWYRANFGKGDFLPILADETRFRQRLAAAVPAASGFRSEAVPDGRKMILFVGRLVPLKNIPLLMEACLPLKTEARLVIVGEGECEDAVRKLDADLELETCFAGARFGADLLACYQAADLLVLPSRQEAFGAVVGEALMAGCPVAVSKKAGARTLVREGRNGELFSPDDVASLTDALRKILARTGDRDVSAVRESLCPETFEESFRSWINRLVKR